jgi:hypothetical protein
MHSQRAELHASRPNFEFGALLEAGQQQQQKLRALVETLRYTLSGRHAPPGRSADTDTVGRLVGKLQVSGA